MWIAPDKHHCYAAEVRALLDSALAGPVARTDVEAVVGRLSFLARACRWGNVFLQSLYERLFSVQSPPPPSLQLSNRAMDDCHFGGT